MVGSYFSILGYDKKGEVNARDGENESKGTVRPHSRRTPQGVGGTGSHRLLGRRFPLSEDD